MRILHSADAPTIAPNARLVEILAAISEDFLRDVVRALAFPRHFTAAPTNNRLAADWIAAQFRAAGYQPFFQGQYANVVAAPLTGTGVGVPSWEGPGVGNGDQRAAADKPTPLPSQEGNFRKSILLVGAHYDTVPGTPGADDNASAVAALLACAKAVAEHAPNAPVCFVAFNREEEKLRGSADFVKAYLPTSGLRIRQAHILEMVGYCSHRPQSQRKPLSLPINIPSQGNFLGIIGNRRSNFLIDALLPQAQAYLPDLPVVGLQVYFGLERCCYHLLRSDHASFWRRGVLALLWTDTANFRNPHYHRRTDTPDTLDYAFLRRVTQLLLLQILTFSRPQSPANAQEY